MFFQIKNVCYQIGKILNKQYFLLMLSYALVDINHMYATKYLQEYKI